MQEIKLDFIGVRLSQDNITQTCLNRKYIIRLYHIHIYKVFTNSEMIFATMYTNNFCSSRNNKIVDTVIQSHTFQSNFLII